jgi:MoxR-like ATPase
MSYEKIFKPIEPSGDVVPPKSSVDRRDGSVYVFHSDDLVLAVNVALATARPLFLRGPAGAGKSSLARSIARIMKRRYYERVISSRTTLHDLLWRVDALRRLADAQVNRLQDKISAYIEPGILWWAFDPLSARKMGCASDPTILDGAVEAMTAEARAAIPAVVLLDEIDKADPDLPNDLLVPLGSLQFDVEPLEIRVAAQAPPLVVITTNEEREMPPAFLRRCLVHTVKPPTPEIMKTIAEAHFGKRDDSLYQAVIDKLEPLQSGGRGSTAELLDAIHACIRLGIRTDSPDWAQLAELTLWKSGGGPGA